MLVVLRHNLGIARVRRQVHRKRHELLAYDWLRAVNNELVDDGYALSIGECGLELVFLGHMVEELEDEGAETWRLQDLDELRNHASVVDLAADFGIEGQVEEQPEGYLEQQLVVAWYKSVELVDNIVILHLTLVLSEDAELLQEVQHDKQEVRIVPIQHRYQLCNNAPVLHLALDLQILCQVQEQVEGHEEHLLLFLDHDGQLSFLPLHVLGHLLVLLRPLSPL